MPIVMASLSQRAGRLSRRFVLYFGSLLLCWPLLRFITFALPRKPEIVEVSGELRGDTFLSKEDFIIFAADSDLWAVSRTCTHLGCRLNYKEQENILECPCHQSRFSTSGEVVRGPAERPLPRYSVKRTETPSTYLVTIQ